MNQELGQLRFSPKPLDRVLEGTNLQAFSLLRVESSGGDI
jgi:hypothetical protein